MSTSVREIHVSSQPDSTYFLRVDWSGRDLGSGFRLVLTDGQDAWRGEVSDTTLRGEAEELEMQTEKYIHDLQEALTGAQSSDTFSFTLTTSRASSVTLAYEKVQKDISFRLGSVALTSVPEPAEALRDLLSHSLRRGNSLDHQNHNLKEENGKLRREQQRITADLQRYVGGKDALEAELYSRFVLVLNEKKAKIRSLQETLSQLQEARSSKGQRNKDPVGSAQTAGEEEEAAEEDDYGGSTDEEPEEVKAPAASSVQSRDPSTPILLDDLTDVAPSRKRRFRHLGSVEPATKKPPASHRKRSESPAGSSKQQTPQSSSDAAAATSAAAAAAVTAEDLFEDF